MRNDTTKDQPKCVFIHPRKGIHCMMHALQGSKYCIRHQHLEGDVPGTTTARHLERIKDDLPD